MRNVAPLLVTTLVERELEAGGSLCTADSVLGPASLRRSCCDKDGARRGSLLPSPNVVDTLLEDARGSRK